ncbi:MFS transporter [Peribacillus sp. NPDC097675]|uniref:MFS transporter n=1 Tax=Peribacillus sp. NPDC097675 TaxID=3390618 RepID=UPI003CFFFA6D
MVKPNSKISKRAWIIILLLFFLTGISNVEKAMLGYASVPIMDELGLSPSEWGLIGSSFYWLFAISAILGGTVADKIGTKRVITIMALLWAAVQFSTLFVYSLPVLLATRIILGAAEGPAYPIAMTAASKWLPKEKTGTGLSLVSIGAPVGLAISAPICVFIIVQFGWRSAFLAAGITTMIWLVFWVLLGKDRPENKVENEASIVSSTDSTDSFLPYLFSKNYLIIMLAGFAAYWSMAVGMVWLPNYFVKVLGVGDAGLSLAVTLPGIMITISQLSFSIFSDRLYRKTGSMVQSRVYVMGPIVIGGGLCYSMGAMSNSTVMAVALLTLGLTLGSVILVIGPAMLVDIMLPQHQGKAQGIFIAFASLGGICAPYITGSLVESGSSISSGFHNAFFVMALVLIVCGTLVWAGIRPQKIQAELQPISDIK